MIDSGPSEGRSGAIPGDPPPSSGTNGEKPASDAFRRLILQVGELREYVSYLVAARVDAIKASARKIAVLAALGVVGLVALVALVATSVVLLLTGFSEGLGILVGGRLWLGNLIIGLFFLVLLFGGGLVAMGYVKKVSRERTIRKYEERQGRQRARFGRDVTDQASAARASAKR